MRHKSTLTENDSNLVIEMYNSGMYLKDIASSFHCRVTKITDILHCAGIRTNNELFAYLQFRHGICTSQI